MQVGRIGKSERERKVQSVTSHVLFVCARSHEHDVNAHVDVRSQSKAPSLGFKDTISHLA